MGGIAVADGAVESEGQLVCGCDDGEDLSAALPAQQLLYAGIELPPDAAVLGFVGEIAGNFGVPRVGSALKGAPGVAVAEHAAVLLPDEPGIDGRVLRQAAGEFRLGRDFIFKADGRLRNVFRVDGEHGGNVGRDGFSNGHGITSISGNTASFPFGGPFSPKALAELYGAALVFGSYGSTNFEKVQNFFAKNCPPPKRWRV